MKITKEMLKTCTIEINKKDKLVYLVDVKKAKIDNLPMLYTNPTATYLKNIKSVFLFRYENKALFNKLVKSFEAEPLEIIATLEAEANKLAEAEKMTWLQPFKTNSYIFKYSICLCFGIAQGKIDKVKLQNGTSNRTKLDADDIIITTDEVVIKKGVKTTTNA
jgi:hypothetical protein